MIRIGHFIDTEVVGGAEVVLLDLCRGLAEHDFEPVIFHFRHPQIPVVARQSGIRCISLAGYSDYKVPVRLYRFAHDFAGVLESEAIELLHSHLFGPIVASTFTRLYRAMPHIGTLHDIYIVQEKMRRIRLLQLAALTGTHLVSISNNMRAFYTSGHYFPASRFHLIPNGIEIAAPQPPEPRSGDEVRVICVARLIPLKHHDLLIRALNTLRHRDRVKLWLVGEGPEEVRLRTMVGELGLDAQVVFTGFEQHVRALLLNSDVFVLASDSEGCSRSILESMSAGLPAVVTDAGGNRDLVLDGQTGFVVPIGDTAQFAARLDDLIADVELRRRFGDAAQAHAQTNFNRQRMIRDYCNLYRSLLDR